MVLQMPATQTWHPPMVLQIQRDTSNVTVQIQRDTSEWRYRYNVTLQSDATDTTWHFRVMLQIQRDTSEWRYRYNVTLQIQRDTSDVTLQLQHDTSDVTLQIQHDTSDVTLQIQHDTSDVTLQIQRDTSDVMLQIQHLKHNAPDITFQTQRNVRLIDMAQAMSTSFLVQLLLKNTLWFVNWSKIFHVLENNECSYKWLGGHDTDYVGR